MVFENGVKNIQAAAYNGARTVLGNFHVKPRFFTQIREQQRINPDWYRRGPFYPLQLYENSILLQSPRGVMDKAVDSGAEGPWSCLC